MMKFVFCVCLIAFACPAEAGLFDLFGLFGGSSPPPSPPNSNQMAIPPPLNMPAQPIEPTTLPLALFKEAAAEINPNGTAVSVVNGTAAGAALNPAQSPIYETTPDTQLSPQSPAIVAEQVPPTTPTPAVQGSPSTDSTVTNAANTAVVNATAGGTMPNSAGGSAAGGPLAPLMMFTVQGPPTNGTNAATAVKVMAAPTDPANGAAQTAPHPPMDSTHLTALPPPIMSTEPMAPNMLPPTVKGPPSGAPETVTSVGSTNSAVETPPQAPHAQPSPYVAPLVLIPVEPSNGANAAGKDNNGPPVNGSAGAAAAVQTPHQPPIYETSPDAKLPPMPMPSPEQQMDYYDYSPFDCSMPIPPPAYEQPDQQPEGDSTQPPATSEAKKQMADVKMTEQNGKCKDKYPKMVCENHRLFNHCHTMPRLDYYCERTCGYCSDECYNDDETCVWAI